MIQTTLRGPRVVASLPPFVHATREPLFILGGRLLLSLVFLAGATFNVLITLRHPESLRSRLRGHPGRPFRRCATSERTRVNSVSVVERQGNIPRTGPRSAKADHALCIEHQGTRTLLLVRHSSVSLHTAVRADGRPAEAE
jgi:hypothetical protein